MESNFLMKKFPPRMREALNDLSTASVFFYIFSITFFLIKFFHNLYFNNDEEGERPNRQRSKCTFFSLIMMILLFVWSVLLFVNGILLGSMIKCIPMLFQNNNNATAYRILKKQFFYIGMTYAILWVVLFLPGIMISTFWLLLSITYLAWVTITS